ncbi:MAG: response regulator [Candidatus Heimdallarchaeota archaeon]|nr:response regulator [Candidatus Heimdallarchaeota archaeon]
MNDQFEEMIGKTPLINDLISDYIDFAMQIPTDCIFKGTCKIKKNSAITRFESFPGKSDTIIINFQKHNSISSAYDIYASIKGFAVSERDLSQSIKELAIIDNKLGNSLEKMTEYLYDNEDELERIHGLMKLTRFNDEYIDLFDAENSDELIKYINSTRFLNIHTYIGEILKIFTGVNYEDQVRSQITTLKQRQKVIMIRSRIYDPKSKLLVNIIVDITSNEQARQKLEESEIRFNKLFEEIPLAISIMRNSRLFRCNQKFLTEHGYNTFSEVVGKHTDEFVAQNNQQILVKNRADRIISKSNKTKKYKINMLRKDGTTYPAVIHAQRINYDGEIFSIGIEVNLTDQIEHEILQKKLMETQRRESLAVLSGGIAHDFNNLLFILSGGLNILKGNPYSDEDLELIDDLLRTTNNASNMIKQLLTYSGQYESSEEIIEITKTIEESNSMYRLAVPKNIIFTTKITIDPSNIAISASDLTQIIMNLLINASDAIGTANGEINLMVTSSALNSRGGKIYRFPDIENMDGKFVKLTIEDTGKGIEEDKIINIFDPFFSTKSSGRGLGLSVVHGIITGANGCIEVESELNRGTSISVYLPISKEITAVINEEENSVKIEPIKVLICDDDIGVQKILSNMINQLNFESRSCDDGIECLKILEVEPDYQLLILDLTMPKMNGYELLRKVMILYPELKILISSGFISKETEIMKNEIIETIQKPYTKDQLERKISSLFEK